LLWIDEFESDIYDPSVRDISSLDSDSDSPAYVSMRQHASAYVSIRQHALLLLLEFESGMYDPSVRDISAFESLHSASDWPAYVGIHIRHTSAYVRLRQHTSAFDSPEHESPVSSVLVSLSLVYVIVAACVTSSSSP
jgi:hypothetical protein